jgi:hypothetical protein
VWRQIERYIVGLSAWRAFRYWFWAHFGLILYGMRPFSYVFTVLCALAGVRITLASAGGSACIAITPLVRLQQVNRVLIDWLIDLLAPWDREFKIGSRSTEFN